MWRPLVTHPGRGQHLPQGVTARTIAFGNRLTWVQVTALLLVLCVILGWGLCLSEPRLLSGCAGSRQHLACPVASLTRGVFSLSVVTLVVDTGFFRFSLPFLTMAPDAGLRWPYHAPWRQASSTDPRDPQILFLRGESQSGGLGADAGTELMVRSIVGRPPSLWEPGGL